MEEFNSKIDDIRVSTCFNNSSFYGLKSSVLKSGICKYCRRGEKEKFKWCVIEMLLFVYHNKGNMLVTNLLNRLKILLVEEISFSEIDRLYLSINKLEEFEKSGRKDFSKIIDFCDIVGECKRGRNISYLKCWWKYNKENIELDDITLDKVLKFKKEGDSDYLLKLGELLIRYIDEKDERFLSIYFDMLEIKECGKRYKRKGGGYLFMEIIRDYCHHYKMLKLFDFGLEMFFRKDMKEREYYGIWISMIVLNRDKFIFDNDINNYDKNINIEDCWNYIISRENMEIDDYVVQDYHVSKKYGLDKFAEIGGWVKDEDIELLGEENFLKYKKFYISKKKEYSDNSLLDNKKISNQKDDKKMIIIKKKKGKKNSNENLENSLEFIDGKYFETDKISICQETTCGNKVMCFEYNGKIYKEGRESMNYNRDYICFDKCKEIFGLRKIGMRRLVSNFTIRKKDKSKKSWINNWEKVIENDKKIIYCEMRKIGKGEELIKRKDLLENIDILKEVVKIALVRGIFRVSDFNLRNILLESEENKITSVDEGNIGSRVSIIGGSNKWLIPIINKKGIIEGLLNDINFKIERKKKYICKVLKKYNFDDPLIKKILYNYDNIKEEIIKEGIILSEI